VKSQVDPEKIDITESYRIKARIFLFVVIALLVLLIKAGHLKPAPRTHLCGYLSSPSHLR